MSDDKQKNQEKQQSFPSNSSNFHKENKVARKWVNSGAQFLIRWSPLGGSGFAFISLLFKQEWIIAILVFPVMIVTVAWAAFTESFLTKIQAYAREFGEHGANVFVAWLKGISSAIKWQLAEVEDKYLKCQGNACVHYTTEGTSSIFNPLLKDVFVPLELSGEFIRDITGENIPNPRGYQWDEQLVKLMNQKDGLTIWDVLKRVPHNPAYRTLAILAWGGYGKTTLLRHLTYAYSQKKLLRGVPKLLPVLLLLRKWQTLIATERPDLITLIEEYHIPSLPQGNNLKRPSNWVKNLLLNQNKILILLDGFDEVKEEWRESIGQWISKMMQKYSNSCFILTSRPAAYKSYKSENQPNILRLKAFNQAQRERFINQWYLSRERHISAEPDNPVVRQTAQQKSANLVQQLQKREELNDLARNPLLLNMIVNLHSVAPTDTSDLSRQIQLPQRRSELYREIFRLQLGDRPLVKQISMCLDSDKSQRILQGLALYMVQENKPEIEAQLLINQLERIINQLQQEHLLDEIVDINKFLKQMIDISELLVKKDKNYEFAHLSFQGYLAAKEIIKTQQEDLLISNWQESWWRETILLYSAQVNPNNLLKNLINIGTKEAITLALRCIEETPRKIDLQVEVELQTLKLKLNLVLFEKLEEYLKNKQWQQANKETYKLIIQIGDKDEKGYVSEEDLNKFPCEELRIINNLWVKNSKGKFGFTVQKQIWLDCGGKIGEYENKVYQKFAEQLRWYNKKTNKWYSDITYEKVMGSEIPKGHLPVNEGTIRLVKEKMVTAVLKRKRLEEEKRLRENLKRKIREREESDKLIDKGNLSIEIMKIQEEINDCEREKQKESMNENQRIAVSCRRCVHLFSRTEACGL